MSGLCTRSARSRACCKNRTKQRNRSAKFSSAVGLPPARDRMGEALLLTFRLATGGYVGLAAPCLLVLKTHPHAGQAGGSFGGVVHAKCA